MYMYTSTYIPKQISPSKSSAPPPGFAPNSGATRRSSWPPPGVAAPARRDAPRGCAAASAHAPGENSLCGAPVELGWFNGKT